MYGLTFDIHVHRTTGRINGAGTNIIGESKLAKVMNIFLRSY